MATPKKFATQQVFEIVLRNPDTYAVFAYLTDCKTSGLTSEVEMVYPTGGRGNLYLSRGFAHSRRAMLEVSKALYHTELIALQSGNAIVTGSGQSGVWYDEITAGSGGSLETTFTGQGTVGSEIRWLYKVDSNGNVTDTYEQDSATAAGKFTYTPGTKAFAFDAGDTPTEGDDFYCVYDIDPGTTAQTMSVSDEQPSTALVTAFGLVSDCDGTLYQFQLSGLAQIDGTINMEVSADGDPAEQPFSLEFVKSCSSSELYKMVVFDEDDIA